MGNDSLTSNPLCDEVRNIARDAPMPKGTRTRLHAIAWDIENEIGRLKAERDQFFKDYTDAVAQFAAQETDGIDGRPDTRTALTPACTEASRSVRPSIDVPANEVKA